MKFCPKCGVQLDDAAVFCNACGANLGEAAPAAPEVDVFDHTAEFDAKDISDNKAFAMLVYLLSWIGIVIALLGSRDSKYLQFHIRQAIKIQVASILVSIVTAVLVWTVIVPIAGAIASVFLFVLQIIAFFQICAGKAKEPVLIRNIPFFN